MLSRLAAFAMFPTILVALGCGGMPASSGGSGGDDGKVHPATNGTAISETVACSTLNMAQSAQITALACVATSVDCPDLLRFEFGTACMEYDQGSVAGCVAYYATATTCDALQTAIGVCAVAPVAGSAPTGCP
jgi:hypothetical protein